MPDRLQKILSRAGVASRRASEKLMLEGRVTVNGVTVRELGFKADAAADDIRVDGRRLAIAERRRHVLLNKPRGYVCTRLDPQRRPTVLDLLPGLREYLYPVGRLDFDSEGLLLMTNDGDLAARLTHPRYGVSRVYEARVLGTPDEHDLSRLRKGIVIDGQRTGPAEVSLHPSANLRHAQARPERSRGPSVSDRARRPAGTSQATLVVTVREGWNRQVRKMCDAIGHPVTALRRIAIGPIRDSALPIGGWRDLTEVEVRRLRAATETTRSRHQPKPEP